MALTKVTYSMISGAQINALDYGIDPTGATDSSAALQAALDACTDGQILEISGDILLDNQVTAPSTLGGIVGGGMGITTITFTKEQPVPSPVYDGSACAIVIDGVTNAVFSDFSIEYTGTYYTPGSPYLGVVTGLYFKECSNVIVRRVEATGFNCAGVHFIGTALTQDLRNTVEECYLHHNMQAGCYIDHQKFFTIRNCKLEYNGDPLEGGTGYGFSANTGGNNEDLLVTENHTYHNYRKGIDFHSGLNVVCTDNVCIQDRLHGIFYENTSTVVGDILIANNYVECDPTDYMTAPYDFFKGISVYLVNNAAAMLPNVTIVGNILKNMEKDNGSSILPIYVNDQTGDRTLVNISKNTVRGGDADWGIFVESATNANEMTANIEGNIISLGSLTYYGIGVTPYDPLSAGAAGYCQIVNNNIIGVSCAGPLFSVKTGMKAVNISGNTAFLTTLGYEAFKVENTTNSQVQIKDNRISATSDATTNKIVYGNQLVTYVSGNAIGGAEQVNLARAATSDNAIVSWRGSKDLAASTLTDVTLFCQQNTQGYYRVRWSAYNNTAAPATATAGGEFVFVAAWSDNGQITSSSITSISALAANNGATNISLTWGIASGIVGDYARTLQVTANVACSLCYEVEAVMSLNSTTVAPLPML